jgi:V/A-type H+-transporting ATPase subunit F
MTQKIGVIGHESFTLGFRLAGIKRAREPDEDEYADHLEEMLDDPELGILVCHADDLEDLPRRTGEKLEETVDPVVIRVGEEGHGDLRERVKQAIGIDLFQEDASPPDPA